MMWLSAGTLFGMVFAIVALALAVGAAYPNLDADNAAKVAASAGGLVYMILCMSFIGAVVVLEAWPVYAIFTSRFTQVPLSAATQASVFAVVRRRDRHHRRGADRARSATASGVSTRSSPSAGWFGCPAPSASRHPCSGGKRIVAAPQPVRGSTRSWRAGRRRCARMRPRRAQAVGIQPLVQDHRVVERFARRNRAYSPVSHCCCAAPRWIVREQRAARLGESMPRAYAASRRAIAAPRYAEKVSASLPARRGEIWRAARSPRSREEELGAAMADEGGERLVERGLAGQVDRVVQQLVDDRSRPGAPGRSAAVELSSGSSNQPSVLKATAGRT